MLLLLRHQSHRACLIFPHARSISQSVPFFVFRVFLSFLHCLPVPIHRHHAFLVVPSDPSILVYWWQYLIIITFFGVYLLVAVGMITSFLPDDRYSTFVDFFNIVILNLEEAIRSVVRSYDQSYWECLRVQHLVVCSPVCIPG